MEDEINLQQNEIKFSQNRSVKQHLVNFLSKHKLKLLIFEFLALWGFLTTFFLGISFRRYSPILAEDLPLSKTDFEDIDLVKKTYEQISHTCFDSAIIFLIAFVLLLVAHRYTKRSNQNIKKLK